MAELARGVGKPHPPLFAPLLRASACQVEALPPAAFLADATKLAKGLSELRRALALSAVVTAAPAAMEAEALGADVDRAAWPPRVRGPAPRAATATENFDAAWAQSPELQAALEATRRLGATQAEDLVIVAALTGPATLLRQVLAPDETPDEAAWELSGRALAALTHLFAQAGASVVAIVEQVAPAEGWRGPLGTIANVARFHRIPALLVFEGVAAPAAWPPPLIACLAPGVTTATGKPHGTAFAPDPAAWSDAASVPPGARLVTTAGEVAADVPLADLRAACAAARRVQDAAT